MPRLLLIVTVLSLLAFPGRAQEQVVVLGNVDDPQMRLQRSEVRNLFMGNLAPEGLTPVVLPPAHPARVVFNTRVVGLTESRVQSYWAQMRFTGRAREPRELRDIPQLLAYLQETPGAVGYVPAGEEIPEGLRVIYRSD